MLDNSDVNYRCVLRFSVDFLILFGKIVLTVITAAVSSIFPQSKKSLKDEIVLVTGAGKGLGKEIALKFASLDAIVVLWDIDEKAILEVALEIRKRGGRAFAFHCDVSSWESVESAGRRVQQEVGDVTILVNNAGILQNRPFLELKIEKIKRTFEINVMAHFWSTRYFLPKMLEMNKGHIVAVASLGGFIGWLYMTDYCATKFAAIGMMEAIEEELRYMNKENNIHCTTVCPVTIDTGLNQNPTTRSRFLVPILSPESAASDIVTAVQRNERVITIPRRFMYLLQIQRLFPRKVTQMILDFAEYNLLPNNPED